MREAVGQHLNEVTVAEGRYQYPVRCEDCGTVLGTVTFDVARNRKFDGADQGLICGTCSGLRGA